MAGEIADLLQVRIEKAKALLPGETVNAIAAVDWRAAVLSMRAKHGYTFEQLGDLELETELMLAGLVTPENYPKELSGRMKISQRESNDLVNEMNDLVFKKIREELIKITERKKTFANDRVAEKPVREFQPIKIVNIPEIPRPPVAQAVPQKITPIDLKEEKMNKDVLSSAGIEIINKKESSSDALSPVMLPNRQDMLLKLQKPELIAKKPEEVHPILAQKLSTSVKIPSVKTEHTLGNITKSAGADSGEVRSSKVDPYREIPE